jgi:hypothetical protein
MKAVTCPHLILCSLCFALHPVFVVIEPSHSDGSAPSARQHRAHGVSRGWLEQERSSPPAGAGGSIPRPLPPARSGGLFTHAGYTPSSRWGLYAAARSARSSPTTDTRQRRTADGGRTATNREHRATNRKLSTIATWFDGLDRALASYYGSAATDERVSALQAWMKSRRDSLLAEYQRDVTARKAPAGKGVGAVRVFGFWLGTRYAMDRFRRAPEQRFPPIALAAPRDRPDFLSLYDSGLKRFELATRLAAPFPASRLAVEFVRSVNLGIHEGAHALIFANGEDGLLSELGVYAVQTELALPLASHDAEIADAYRLGTRHFPEVAAWFSAGIKNSNRALAPDYLEAEYLSFVLGPWLRGTGPPLDPFAFRRVGDEAEFTLQEALENAAALARPVDPRKAPDSDGPIAPEVLVDRYCLEAGIKDATTKKKIGALVHWIHAAYAGSVEGGEFVKLASAMDRLRHYAKRTGQRRIATPPAQVVRDRALFLDFLAALQQQLDTIFGPPTRRPVPPGYV